MHQFSYEDGDHNDAPGLKGLVLGCLLSSGILICAVGTVLLLVLHH